MKLFLMTKILLLTLIFFNFASCKNVQSGYSNEYKVPECITPDYKNFMLEWGYDYENSPEIMGYQLNENGHLLFYRQVRESTKKTFDTLGRIEGEKICELLARLNSEMSKVPTVREPGKELSFIILTKPQVGTLNTFIWNEHKTYGSRRYRELFDVLLTIIPPNLKNENE
jgi:hypothetical protein